MAYREPVHALKERLESLEKELSAARARASELEDLKRDESRLASEIASLRRTIEGLEAERGRRALPVLENLRIASPCSARWEEMIGDERVRFCGHCAKNVFNLSAMRRDEAEALVAEKDGKMCVRMYQRADGTVLTADCPVGVKRKRVRRIAALAIAGGGVSAALAAMTSGTRMGAPRVVTGDVEPVATAMGSVAATSEPTPSPTPEANPRPMMGAVAPRHAEDPTKLARPPFVGQARLKKAQ